MTLIQSQTLGSAASSIVLSSIPQTYTDLYVVLSPRSSQTGTTIESVRVTFNSDGIGSGLYRAYYLFRNIGASVASSFQNAISLEASAPSNNSTANTFGNIQIHLPNYSGSTTKTGSADSVSENNGSATGIAITALRYDSTAAISSITFLLSNGNFVAGSTASLYGILKGSSSVVVS
jgi:hypothetical protein